jgi:hypothetical protein
VIERLLTDPVEILPHDTDGQDPYGNPVDSWAAPGDGVSVHGRLVPLTADEVDVDRNTQTSTHRLYLPAGTAISGRDRVVTPLGVMEVHGPPRAHTSPFSGPNHVAVELKKADD